VADHSKRKSEAIEIAPEAFHGVIGDWVKLIAPHTEADPVALLVDALTASGNVIGPGPYFMQGRTKHFACLYTVIVGNTARARKGTSRDEVGSLFRDIADDPTEMWLFGWVLGSIKTGLSTGEGLVKALEVEPDFRPIEPRLFIYEPEFARTLQVMKREGNTLSALVRSIWDSGSSGVMTKIKPLHVIGAHVSILGHVTQEELLRHLNETEMASGFANRFNWHWVKRSSRLPESSTPSMDDYEKIKIRLKANLESARSVREMRRSREAEEMWAMIYGDSRIGADGYFDDELGGLVGFLLARTEAQIIRLSMIYALLDGSHVIEVEHLVAAIAVWEHSARSIAHIFGDSQGDPVADRIMEGLEEVADGGLTRTQLSALFSRHVSAMRMDITLKTLEEKGFIRFEKVETGGGPATVYFAKRAKRAKEVPGLSGTDSLISLISHFVGRIDWDWVLDERDEDDDD